VPRINLPSTPRVRWTALAAVVLVAAAAVTVWATRDRGPAPVRTQDAFVSAPAAPGSADQVRIDTTTYYPERTPAPAVLLAHGFGGDKKSVDAQARELAQRGFLVLAWSARGFGHSTGQIGLNDPDREVADASRLIDRLIAGHDVATGPGGAPEIGVTGGSYGGSLSLLLAGTDHRVRALAPVITYNDLGQALIPNAAAAAPPSATTPAAGAFSPDGVFKKNWAGIFFSAGSGAAAASTPSAEAPEAGQKTTETGSATGTAPQVAAPPAGRSLPAANPCGRFTAEVCQAYTELATTGKASPATVALLHRVSPASVTGKITAPTLLVQGESDTLFGLDQSDATARQITAAGGSVRTIWYTGGHDGGTPGPQLRAKIGDFLWSELTGQGDPGHGFSYDVQGTLRANGTPSVRTVNAAAYPGLAGAVTERRQVPLTGPMQPVVRPAGANPSAVSGIPGLNGLAASTSRLAPLFSNDPPGQAAQFGTAPFDSQVLLAGSSTVHLQVAADPEHPLPEAVLFAKLYDVGQDGTRVLPANAIAPFRVTGLPADGTPVDVTVTLPGVVRPIDSGHSLRLVVGTTDQAYSVPSQPGVFRIGIAPGAALAVPVVPGASVGAPVPVGQLIGIGATLLVAIAAMAFAAVRRRRAHDIDPALADTPLVISGLRKQYAGGFTAVRDLSCKANLELYWAATGRPAEKAHFAEALEIAGLGDAVHRRVKTYSQGMRQRLAIAQAMLGLPELMVLDEPTNGLDPPQIHQMREVLQRYAATGRTVVVSSHLLAEVEQTCSHVVVMHRGRLVASGEVGELAASSGEATFRVDDPAAAAAALKSVTGVSDIETEGDLVHANLDGLPRASAVAALVQAGVAVEQAGPRRRLEDAFLQLVGDDS